MLPAGISLATPAVNLSSSPEKKLVWPSTKGTPGGVVSNLGIVAVAVMTSQRADVLLPLLSHTLSEEWDKQNTHTHPP